MNGARSRDGGGGRPGLLPGPGPSGTARQRDARPGADGSDSLAAPCQTTAPSRPATRAR